MGDERKIGHVSGRIIITDSTEKLNGDRPRLAGPEFQKNLIAWQCSRPARSRHDYATFEARVHRGQSNCKVSRATEEFKTPEPIHYREATGLAKFVERKRRCFRNYVRKLRSDSDETPVQDTLNHQERILNETEARLEKSYLKNPEITGIWNISVANVTNATVSDNVAYHSVTIGGANLTKEDLRLNVSDFRGRLTSLERKLDEIDSLLMNTVEINPRSVSDITIFGNIIVTGNLNVVNLTALSINDINETTIADFVDNRDVTVRSVNGVPIENIQFGDSADDYSGVDFYKINRAQVNGNLSFSMINGIDWTILMRDIVWKNKRMHIPGETVIEGVRFNFNCTYTSSIIVLTEMIIIKY